MHNRILHPGRRVKLAFTVLEVLIAMGIFAVGFAAVAAIFPTAILLQKQTVDDVLGQQVARNAQALLEVKGISAAEISTAQGDAWLTDMRVHSINDLLGATGIPHNWPLSDRSYPSSITDLSLRKHFWVPLVMDSDNSATNTSPVVFVFVLRRELDSNFTRFGLDENSWANYMDGYRERVNPLTSVPLNPGVDIDDFWDVPGVVKMSVSVTLVGSRYRRFDMGSNNNRFMSTSGYALRVNAGDKVLDCFGVIHKVETADPDGFIVEHDINQNIFTNEYPNEIWFAHPDRSGKAKPLQRILTLTSAVKP